MENNLKFNVRDFVFEDSEDWLIIQKVDGSFDITAKTDKSKRILQDYLYSITTPIPQPTKI